RRAQHPCPPAHIRFGWQHRVVALCRGGHVGRRTVCTLSGAASCGGRKPVGKIAFLFPGQGSAAIGMGDALAAESPAAQAVLARLAVLAPAVRGLAQAGPREELIRTTNAQPAIFAVDCACYAALVERGVQPDVVAGHSLGEYAALVAADVLDFATGLPLVLQRGALMEQSTAAQPGT